MPPVSKPKRSLRPTFLRAWRQFRGMTQEQAAEPLNMSPENLGKIERGLVPYDQRLLEAAAELYRCEPADLLTRDPNAIDRATADWMALQPSQRNRALRLLRAMEEDDAETAPSEHSFPRRTADPT